MTQFSRIVWNIIIFCIFACITFSAVFSDMMQ